MTFTITQNDTSPSLEVTLGESGNAIDLRYVENIRFIMQDRYERIVVDDDLDGDVRMVEPLHGVVEYMFNPEDTETVGTYQAEFEVTFDDGGIETFPTNGNICVEVVEEVG